MRQSTLAAILAMMLTSTTASAQGADAPLAREAYVLGSQLAKQGQWADALAAYQRSHKLRPHATTLFNIGYVQRALGELVHARASLKSALLRHAAHPGEMDGSLVKEADGYLAELEQRIPRVSLRVAPGGSRLAVDARPLRRDAFSDRVVFVVDQGGEARTVPDTFELMLDPGEHQLRLEAPDGRSKTHTISLAAGQVQAIELELPAVAVETTAQADFGWPIALTALGVGGLLVGTLSGVAALNKESDLAATCPTETTCTPESQTNIDALSTYTNLSTVGLIAGGIVTAAGLSWLTLLAVTEGNAEIGFRLTPTSAAVTGRF